MPDSPYFNPVVWESREFYRDAAPAAISAVERIIQAGILSNGSEVAAFEQEVASFVNTNYGIAVSSCTVGLTLAVKLLAPRKRVLVPSFTFCATALSVLWNESQIVFGKIDPETFNLDFEWAKKMVANHHVDAILFLATAGSVAGLVQFQDLADFYGIPLIIDAAGALGSHDGSSLLSSKANIVSVVSFASKKPLPIGEGGMLLTNNSDIADALRRLRVYGSIDGYYCVETGLNGRMSEINAAIGREFLKHLPEVLQKRRIVAMRIAKESQSIVRWQRVDYAQQSSYADLLCVVDRLLRPILLASFNQAGIEAVPFYDPPVARHPAFRFSQLISLCAEVSEQLEDLAGTTFAFRPTSSYTDAHAKQIIGLLKSLTPNAQR
ncbi:hypothetical protein EXU57_23235 [Segetibacter sp. 3557_3]|uniref:DegT/DnrJ/EryC1/StrS family aminotransferase n=1 Tax=Segetibacter sp. 3557_3 TaxID=2547429 RepID=UPI001058924F|nr:DegT/DnrJ/EryC1/StrS family aminotransferase [Segetibacter sp. 3557_3]TDH18383.1 hypothetical protein EXU57_23235 [Segetibacter sp. 3557_3]